MNRPPCVIPDPTHVTRADARDVAEEVAIAIDQARGRPIAVYVNPDGAVLFTVGNAEPLPLFSLVGVYDARACVRDIADDILALEREAIA